MFGTNARSNASATSRKSGHSSRSDAPYVDIGGGGSNATNKFVRDMVGHSSSSVSMEAYIHHYMPSRFPVAQIITQDDVSNFRLLWVEIMDVKQVDEQGRSRLSILFDVFYRNLFTRSAKFREFFGSDFKERCRILTRQINFFTTLKLDGDIVAVFTELGALHQRLKISNWQYATFVEVLIESIATVLGDKADMILMTSASRVVSFCLYSLLKYTLNSTNIVRDEINVNYHRGPAKENEVKK